MSERDDRLDRIAQEYPQAAIEARAAGLSSTGLRLEADALFQTAARTTAQGRALLKLADEADGIAWVTCSCGCGASRRDDGSIT